MQMKKFLAFLVLALCIGVAGTLFVEHVFLGAPSSNVLNNNTTNVTATNVTATNVTATNVTATNVTTTNVTATNVTTTNVTATNVTATNVTATNVTATNVTVVSSESLAALAARNAATDAQAAQKAAELAAAKAKASEQNVTATQPVVKVLDNITVPANTTENNITPVVIKDTPVIITPAAENTVTGTRPNFDQMAA